MKNRSGMSLFCLLTCSFRREIIDESDVYIDVHKAIRRMAPAPKARYQRRLSHTGRPVADADDGKTSEDTKVGEEDASDNHHRPSLNPMSSENNKGRGRSDSPMTNTVLLRRGSAGIDGRLENVPVRANFDEIKQHLKHLGPSNRASNPKLTKSTTVKIKPGVVVHDGPSPVPAVEETIPEVPRYEEEEAEGDETTSLLKRAITPKDGAHALAQGRYGATGGASLSRSFDETAIPSAPQNKTVDTTKQEDQATQTSANPSTTDLSAAAVTGPGLRTKKSNNSSSSETTESTDTNPYGHRKGLFARSGSITEQVVETRGIKKTVLGMTSSNEDEDEYRQQGNSGSRVNLTTPTTVLPLIEVEEGSGSGEPSTPSPEGETPASPEIPADGSTQNGEGGGKKKNRRKKKKGGRS